MRKMIDLWHKRRQTRCELLSLSSRELADIGINRGDIENIVSEM